MLFGRDGVGSWSLYLPHLVLPFSASGREEHGLSKDGLRRVGVGWSGFGMRCARGHDPFHLLRFPFSAMKGREWVKQEWFGLYGVRWSGFGMRWARGHDPFHLLCFPFSARDKENNGLSKNGLGQVGVGWNGFGMR